MKDLNKDYKKIADHYGVPDKNLSEFKSVKFKPYYMKSKWRISKELKAALPFLFGGIFK